MNRWCAASVLVYALSNALLYCSLLPLWEGEPFHYGYVQEISNLGRLPVLGKSMISEEIWSSLNLVPVSHIVRDSYPALTTYDEYFALTPDERAGRRGQLEQLPRSLRFHAPLAYLCLAPLDKLWSAPPLVARVWRFRCSRANFNSVNVVGGGLPGRQLGLEAWSRLVLLFLIFSTQMFYATVCHIANDWLSVPLSVAVARLCIRFPGDPTMRTRVTLSLGLGLVLLAKAYLLAVVPVACVLVAYGLVELRQFRRLTLFLAIWLALAGPWYGRNLSRYHSLTGTPEEIGGVGLSTVVKVLPAVPWLASAGFMARGSLWTG